MKTLNIDPTHSTAGFLVRHMVVSKVRGSFKSFSGTIAYDPDAIERSSVQVELDVASIDTREEKRDAHLRSADFFDAEHHPRLTFRSTAVKRTGKDTLEVTGDLTMRGVTHPVVLKVEELGGGKDPWGNDRLAWSAHTTVNRKEWGLNWNQVLEAGGVLVSEKVEIELDIQAL
ncbi:MAG: YceI family protein [Kofleriaceae bacterium]|nr:YceI family protein [Kofleriaceae bacterium]MCL4226352.1 YceI family protein [Myxococcales bacterium]